MGYTWGKGAAAVVDHARVGWAGVWSLLYAAGTATGQLAERTPAWTGAELTWAAMHLRWARDLLERQHPELPTVALAVDLGPLDASEQVDTGFSVLDDLTAAALDRLAELVETHLGPADLAVVDQLGADIRAARGVIAGLRP